jgi:hypothetical protein
MKVPVARGAGGLGVPRRPAARVPPGLRDRRHSRAGTGGPVWRRGRATRRVGRDSGAPRLAMKRRAPGCIEVEKGQEARWAARRRRREALVRWGAGPVS